MPAVLLAALIALGAKGITVLGPKLVELLAALISAAINALLPSEDEPKALALEGLLEVATRVVSRLEESPGSGAEKRLSAARVLTNWNQENGSHFRTSEINLALELVVQHAKGGK